MESIMKKPIYECKGTVAYTINKEWNSIDFSSLNNARVSVINILKSSEITNRADADKFIRDIMNMKNLNQLISTVGTYACGIKC